MTRQQAGPRGLEQRVFARWRQLLADQAAPEPAQAAAWAPARVIVGFSGGGDSLALAAILGQLTYLGGPAPILVHVDHAWRPDSAAEQARAAALASALGLAFAARRVPDDSRARHPGVGREEAARRDRYQLLAAAARDAGTDLMAVAHHQDDQAETVMLHLARGSGLAGAGGMAPFRRLVVPWWTESGENGIEVGLWRPLLAEPRSVVRAYAAATGQTAIADPSNDDAGYRRNAIRAGILPELERVVPGATAALARFAGLAADDNAALNEIADALYGGAVTAGGALRRSSVLAQPRAVRRRLVRRWVRSVSGLAELSAERTDAMLTLLANGEPGRWLEIGEGVTVRVTRTGLALVPASTDERVHVDSETTPDWDE